MSRVRINVSLTEEGMAILDRERESMGLSCSAMLEVLLRFWVRAERPIGPEGAQDRAAGGASATEKPRRRSSKAKKA